MKAYLHKQPLGTLAVALLALTGCNNNGNGGDSSSSPNTANTPTCTAKQYLDKKANKCVAKKTQTITFTLADMQVGDKKPLAATASSSLAVTYSSKTPSVCVIMNSQVEALKAGDCTVAASQAGNATTLAATKEATAKVTPARTSKLTATGMTTCGDFAYGASKKHNNGLSCSLTKDADGDPIPAGQDGHIQAGQKMSYTKLTRNGAECVKDNVTGLVWEQKVNDVKNIRHYAHNYSWYNPDSKTNGSDAGKNNGAGAQNAGTCQGSACDTYAYIQALNKANYCGYSDWRMPTVDELVSLLDYSNLHHTINSVFVYTQSHPYSSSTSYGASRMWTVNFRGGLQVPYGKKGGDYVRAVR